MGCCDACREWASMEVLTGGHLGLLHWSQAPINTEVPCLAAYILDTASRNNVDVKVCFSIERIPGAQPH